ncbi:MAG: GntR family transcriptional regulator [Victivallales bacterium]|jgi:DNA-binding transcriptional regulator YhcF (GntR family)|nr:GntR family transcriptional regulator [Victivallales bacterium]
MALAKYQKIARELYDSIVHNELKPGDKLPSAVELRKRYGVSHITALKVYQQLQEQNCIENYSGRGYFVKKSHDLFKDAATQAIGLAIRPLWGYHKSDQYFNEITYGIQQECLRRCLSWHQHFSTRILDLQQFSYSNVPELKSGFLKMADKVDGFLVDERMPDDVLSEIIRDINKPMVVVNRKSTLTEVDSVFPALGAALKMALDLAMRLDYSNYILALSEFAMPGSLLEQLRHAFCEFIADNGIASANFRVIPGCNLVPHEKSMKDIRRSAVDMPPGKCLLISDVIQFFPVVGATGVDGFLGTSDTWRYVPEYADIAALQSKPIEVGKMAVNILCQRIAGNSVDRGCHSPSPEFSVGKTL